MYYKHDCILQLTWRKWNLPFFNLVGGYFIYITKAIVFNFSISLNLFTLVLTFPRPISFQPWSSLHLIHQCIIMRRSTIHRRTLKQKRLRLYQACRSQLHYGRAIRSVGDSIKTLFNGRSGGLGTCPAHHAPRATGAPLRIPLQFLR